MEAQANGLELALAHHKAGDLDKAERLYVETLQAQPENGDALRYLGILFFQRGDFVGAVDTLRDAIRVASNDVSAWYNLGVVLAASGDSAGAEQAYRRVLEFNPRHALAILNLGNLAAESNRNKDAASLYLRALAANPEFAAAYNNLGRLYKNAGDYGKAIPLLETAIRLDPKSIEGYSNLAVTFMHIGNANEGIKYFLQAANMAPDKISYIEDALILICYADNADPQFVTEVHKHWGELKQRSVNPYSTRRRDPNRTRLRVGYVSPDFRRHSVYFFIAQILARHDRERFEVYCYSNVEKPDEQTEHVRSLADHWRDIRDLTDDQAAQCISDDQIDILIDLAGHTVNTRLGVLALKPAPVQATYLGYPATTGLSCVDYRITDAAADPPGMTERYYVEKIARVPGCFLTYKPPVNGPEISPSPFVENGFVTFGSFNNTLKVGPKTVHRWSQVLKAIPDARLIIKSHLLEKPDARSHLSRLFEDQGIGAERLSLLPFFDDTNDHLSYYSQVDIALDSFPYNGTTTTCEALWMGVPTITLIGNTHPSRVGLTLLKTVGLEELAAPDADAYVGIAKGLASDTKRLCDLRKSMRGRIESSALCDHEAFTRRFETTLQQMLHEKELTTS